MSNKQKFISTVLALGVLAAIVFLADKAQAFIPMYLGGGQVAFGGFIQNVQFCECPIPGALIDVNGEAGGIGGTGGFGGKVFYRPGSNVTIAGAGQFLRPPPFVIGTVGLTPYLCGTIKVDEHGPYCKFFGSGFELKSIGAFP